MSKFFNDTRVAAGRNAGADPVVTDLDAAIGSLKKAAQSNGSKTHSTENDVGRLLLPLEQTDQVTADVAASRLANCASIRLPRNEEKSFLVTQYNPSMQAAVEAYRTLRTRLTKQQTKRGMRSLVITSAAQGEGKSLTAFNLALCYAKMPNFPVLLVDADVRSQGLSRLLGDSDSPGLTKVLETGGDYQSAILHTDCSALYALPAGSSSTSPSELFSGPNWKEFMGWASETFRLVIVDCPPVLNVSDFELVMAPCDSAILVVRSRKTASTHLSKVLAQVDPRKMAGVVFNATEEQINGYYPAA
jgi:capsular exopolysaccharide synthesis family protein